MNNYKTKHILSSAIKDVERMLHVYEKHQDHIQAWEGLGKPHGEGCTILNMN